ncbi:MAG: hypothetical protein COC01_01770 [Bacteroidetes bacterium]|nr:polyprenol phosphomannose-dependent alpha 1,6 mannosyltransferase MptB [Bacteroidia bacterium]PCH69362.1 MAG: hypothetical protein COC01_01770 [Bacteroidota bacterium]
MTRNKTASNYFLFFFSLIGYLLICYTTLRINFTQVITLFSGLFLIYYFLIKRLQSDREINVGIGVGMVFRLSLLFCIPELSDDVYRFFWDGMIYDSGTNPYLSTPTEIISQLKTENYQLTTIYNHLNSKEYYSIYPPICQYLYWICFKLSNNTILGFSISLRFIFILFDLLNLVLIKSLLKRFNLPAKNILLYWINPLIIVELIGNLHFEIIMIGFILVSIWFLAKTNWIISAITLGLAVSTKLLPLIFLPFLFKRLEFKKWIIYCLLTGLVFAGFFIPFYDIALIQNFLSSIDLYFQKFEFNASIYYIIRWIGFKTVGYNIIQQTGMGLAIITFLLIIYLAIKDKSKDLSGLPFLILTSLTIYFLLSTTVHPWYICTLVALGIFTNLKYPILWSFLILLSYYTYSSQPYSENFVLVSVEYVLLFGYFGYEAYFYKKYHSYL